MVLGPLAGSREGEKLGELLDMDLDDESLRSDAAEFEERVSKVVAADAELAEYVRRLKAGEMDAARIKSLRQSSPLGHILAAGLANAYHGRDVMKESIQEAADHVVHDLERYLNTLGTIAAVAPLLGLLGTVVGMIATFQMITLFGTGGPPIIVWFHLVAGSKSVFRGNLMTIFLLMTVVRVPSYAFSGLITLKHLWSMLLVMPAVLGEVFPDIDSEALRGAMQELQSRMQDNYPFFHPMYAGQMLKPPHPVARP